jgi:hypothetical protein
MIPRAAPVALLALSLALAPACNRSPDGDDSGGTSRAKTAAPAPAPKPHAPATAAAPAPAPTSSVAAYPDEVPLGTVTVELREEFTVHQAADLTSPVVAHVGKGEYVNCKATHSNWMKIEYPSGPGQLSPGWVDLRNVMDPRVRVHHGALPAKLVPQFHHDTPGEPPPPPHPPHPVPPG